MTDFQYYLFALLKTSWIWLIVAPFLILIYQIEKKWENGLDDCCSQCRAKERIAMIVHFIKLKKNLKKNPLARQPIRFLEKY